ncbi:L-threonylcarbamoyladenylate synthase [Nigerium massiliense]|uniref:L-threonylcarbamoyladenylate synthase n=1 Tax=Nigerium massiliense TaxID=1522317 RepID=UPI000693F4DB|nr:L-threonylcarbamoyladenylate synthase [Nigerium massiliense]
MPDDESLRERVHDASTDLEAALAAAVEAVAAGQVIVLPTDTVYGVGADAFDASAVQALLDAKHRGRDMPPPVLVAEVPMVRSLAGGDHDIVAALGEAFWPGALTLILPAHPSLRIDLGDRGETIAVRVPDHDLTRELLRRTGPLAVSSANISGEDAALTVDEALGMLGDSVAAYIDAGPMSGPVPSTIVDLSGRVPRLLRAGRLTVDQLNAVVPGLLPADDAHIAEAEEEAADRAAPEAEENDGHVAPRAEADPDTAGASETEANRTAADG